VASFPLLPFKEIQEQMAHYILIWGEGIIFMNCKVEMPYAFQRHVNMDNNDTVL
jgi:hypothetical protein